MEYSGGQQVALLAILEARELAKRSDTTNRKAALPMKIQSPSDATVHDNSKQHSAKVAEQSQCDIECFRLMDLPTELRLEIAVYVAASDRALSWKWLHKKPGQEVGTFPALQEHDVLGQVCRQLREETGGLVWKFNTLCFEEAKFGSEYNWQKWKARTTEESGVSDSVHYFLRHVLPSSLRLVRTIVLTVGLPTHTGRRSKFLRFITTTAQVVPHAQIYIVNRTWYLGISPQPQSVRRMVDDFVSDGNELVQSLAQQGFNTADWSWRILPYLPANDVHCLDIMDHGLRDEWIHSGTVKRCHLCQTLDMGFQPH